jgi:hydrogenase maturation protease
VTRPAAAGDIPVVGAPVVDALGAGAPQDGVLVVGYGNTLRSDDGVGPAVAARLAGDRRLGGVDVRSMHQLTPELAFDASGVSLLVLVDASADMPAGEVAVTRVPSGAVGGEVMTHHTDPAGIAGLARELWGSAPEVVLVSIGVASLEVGDRLSPIVEGAVLRAADAVVAVVEDHGRA